MLNPASMRFVIRIQRQPGKFINGMLVSATRKGFPDRDGAMKHGTQQKDAQKIQRNPVRSHIEREGSLSTTN